MQLTYERMLNMDKLEGILAEKTLRHMLSRESEMDCKKITLWVLAIIGAVAAIAAIAYLVFRFATPDYLEDFDEDFDEDFFSEDEEE